MAGATTESLRRKRLIQVIGISIAAAVLTISMKTIAWLLTGSVGLLSDAAESIVNLVAALVALIVILWSTRPPDEDHTYGHEKADYLSAGFEGALILLASVTIAYAAIDRLLNPAELTDVGVGLAVTFVATLVNFAAARLLRNTGRKERSLTLEADGRHLMADVWTSIGVIVGVGLAYVTGWEALDPLIALAVAANILRTGTSLVGDSMSGLMDRALPADQLDAVTLNFSVKTGQEGKLFGSITSTNIFEALNQKGFEVDKKKIVLPEPIRHVGTHEVTIRLYPGVHAQVKVGVSAANAD